MRWKLYLNGKLAGQRVPSAASAAILVFGSTIVRVGGSDELGREAPKETQRIDLSGNVVVPGFNDAHVHLFEGGRSLLEIDLRESKSLREMLERLRSYVVKLPEGKCVLGGNWDHERWSPPQLPTREDLDSVSTNHAILLHRKDGHVAVANTVALQLAGVSERAHDPPGGAFGREKDGKPNGILYDGAIDVVRKALPKPDDETLGEYLRAAQDYALSLGVTSVQGPVTPQELGVLQKFRSCGELKLRVNAWLDVGHLQLAKELGLKAGFGDNRLRIGTVKVFADGSLGAGTAYYYEPYEGSDERGLLNYSREELQGILRSAHEAGLQLAVHAIGDGAVGLVLDSFTALEGVHTLRHRIEHAQTVAERDLGRLASCGLVASIQPSHLLSDLPWARRKIGDRVRSSYRFRSFLSRNIPVALGTDWPVEDLNPMLTLAAAAFRKPLDGNLDVSTADWSTKERVTVDDALRSYSQGSAYAEHQDGIKGALREGMLADFVVLDRDPTQAVDSQQLAETKVLMTVVDGEIVYTRS